MLARHVRDALHTDVSAALDSAGDPSLVALVSAALALSLAADQGFVHFDDADQSVGPVSGSLPMASLYPVTEVPSGFVGDAQDALELVGAHALLGLAHEVNGQEPLAERKVGIMHDRSGRHAELVAA